MEPHVRLRHLQCLYDVVHTVEEVCVERLLFQKQFTDVSRELLESAGERRANTAMAPRSHKITPIGDPGPSANRSEYHQDPFPNAQQAQAARAEMTSLWQQRAKEGFPMYKPLETKSAQKSASSSPSVVEHSKETSKSSAEGAGRTILDPQGQAATSSAVSQNMQTGGASTSAGAAVVPPLGGFHQPGISKSKSARKRSSRKCSLDQGEKRPRTSSKDEPSKAESAKAKAKAGVKSKAKAKVQMMNLDSSDDESDEC